MQTLGDATLNCRVATRGSNRTADAFIVRVYQTHAERDDVCSWSGNDGRCHTVIDNYSIITDQVRRRRYKEYQSKEQYNHYQQQ